MEPQRDRSYTADREQAQAAKRARLETKVRTWLEEVLGERLLGTLHEALKDGVVLCQLVGKLFPLSKPRRYKHSTLPFVCLDNINFFLTSCKELGMREVSMFTAVELYNDTNMDLVLRTLNSLHKLLAKEGENLQKQTEAQQAKLEAKAQRDAEAKSKRDAEEKAEAEAKARREAEERAEAEAKAKRAAEEQAEAEAKAQREAEEKAEAEKRAAAAAAQEEESGALAQEEEAAKTRRDAEEKAEAEAKARREAEEQAEAEAKAKRAAEEQAEAEAKAQREAEENAAEDARLAKEAEEAEVARKEAEEMATAAIDAPDEEEDEEALAAAARDAIEAEELAVKLGDDAPLMPVPKEEAKVKSQRMFVIDEIVATERIYVEDLAIVCEGFIAPLRDSGISSPQEMQSMFTNIETIWQTNKIMLDRLEGGEASGELIANSFLSMAPYFKMYADFVSTQNAAMDLLNKARNRSNFAKFLAEYRHLWKGMDLHDFLIKPVQRICKYPLLFRELLKATPEGHPEYEVVLEAFEAIQDITAAVNEKKRAAENRFKMVQIHNQIHDIDLNGVKSILEPSRYFVADGEFVRREGKKEQSRHYFLFNDLLIFCKKKEARLSDKMHYNFKEMINVNTTLFSALPDQLDNKARIANAVEVVETVKNIKYIALFPAAADRDNFLTSLDDVIAAARLAEQKRRASQIDDQMKEALLKSQPYAMEEDGIDLAFLGEIVHAMDRVAFDAEEFIIRAGEEGTCMYFVAAGTVHVHVPSGPPVGITKGMFFGEIALFLQERRTVDVQAFTSVVCYRLSKDMCESVMTRHPAIQAQFFELSMARMKENQEGAVTSANANPAWLNAVGRNIIDKENLEDLLAQEDRSGKVQGNERKTEVDEEEEGVISELHRRMTRRTVHAGESVVKAGEEGREMYFIASGEALVHLPGAAPLSLTSGAFFGEIALFLDEKRTVDVSAAEELDLFVLSRDLCEEVVSKHPALHDQFKGLAAARVQENKGKAADKTTPRWMRGLAGTVSA